MTWRVTIITATSEVVVLSSSTPNIILVHDKMGHGRRSAFFLRGRNFYDVRAVQCSGAAEGAHSLCHPTSLLSPVPPSLPPPPLLAAWPFYEISPSDADEGTEDDGERDFHQPLCHSTLIHATQFPAKL